MHLITNPGTPIVSLIFSPCWKCRFYKDCGNMSVDTYVERHLNDTTKKVRETVVRAALSGTEMDSGTRLQLLEIITAKKLQLTKKKRGRLKNL